MTDKDKRKEQGRQNAYKGRITENLACALLICKGYRIISRNFSCGKGTGRGEIDIIALDKKTLVFVEVKYRCRNERTEYAVSLSNKKRVTAAAEHFIGMNSALQNYDVRFDAILFGGFSFPKHIKDAWRCDWW